MSEALQIGSTLDGQYRLERLLGTGGVGTVYAATHLHLAQPRAIKVLHTPYAHIGEPLQRFQQEAKLVSSLGHPSFVQVYDFGADPEGRFYMVMELVPGDTLRKRLEAGPLSIAEVLRLFEPLCAALGQAHQSKVLHRDLKPENLMLTESGGVKILDFGMAKLSSEAGLTQPGVVMGTPHYLSPERARGKRQVGPQTDIFSLGAILYEALTGNMAFPGDTPHAVMLKVVREPVPPLGLPDPELARRLDAVIARACAKAPEDRFLGAPELWQALLNAVTGAAGPGTGPAQEAQEEGTMKAGVFQATLDYIRTHHGDEGMRRLSQMFGPERIQDILSSLPNRRLDMALLHELHRDINSLFDDGSLSVMRNLGRHFAEIALNTIYKGFLGAGDPDTFMRRAHLMFGTWTSRGEFRLRQVEGGWHLRITGDTPTPSLLAATAGGIARSLELVGAEDVHTREVLPEEGGADIYISYRTPQRP
jgi:serine/threonine protein kinase